MQATIQANKAFQYIADLSHVAALPGTYALKISSTFAGAKVAEPRVVFQTTLDRDGLMALRDLIDSEVST
jgi:hypothetical protein